MPKTVLIVEDDKANMMLFMAVMQGNGYDTLQSVNGADCIQLAREHRPDLILMDIKLPTVSGLEHIRALKADSELKNIPVIAVTAFAMKGDEERILAAGCDAYITKPIDFDSFLATVASHLK